MDAKKDAAFLVIRVRDRAFRVSINGIDNEVFIDRAAFSKTGQEDSYSNTPTFLISLDKDQNPQTLRVAAQWMKSRAKRICG